MNIQRWFKRVAKLGIILMLGASMNGCSETMSWQEEALLHDGSKLIVERSVEREGRHEIGQQPPYKKQKLSFVMPSTKQKITWVTDYSQEVGFADFKPLLLDIVREQAYIVTTPMGCLSYNKWGRPNPPYIIFKYQDKTWQQITIEELPIEIKTPNLIISSPDTEVKKSGKRVMTAEMIEWKNHALTGYPQYQTILREPMPNGNGCIKTDYYEGAGWLSPDWFTDQPSLKVCLALCFRKKITSEACPCNELFKEKK